MYTNNPKLARDFVRERHEHLQALCKPGEEMPPGYEPPKTFFKRSLARFGTRLVAIGTRLGGEPSRPTLIRESR